MSSLLFPQSAKTLTKTYYKQGKFFFPSVAIACDHGGEALKKVLIDHLMKTGYFQEKIVLWHGQGQQKEAFALKKNYDHIVHEKSSSPEEKKDNKIHYDLFNLEFPQDYLINHHKTSLDHNVHGEPQEESMHNNQGIAHNLHEFSMDVSREKAIINNENSMLGDMSGLNHQKTNNIDLKENSPNDFSLEQSTIHYPHCMPFILHQLTQGSLGILICTSGLGMAMAANRFPGVRAALCSEESMAYLARTHNNANVLVLGGEFISNNDAMNCLKIFLTTPFSGGRHELRLNLIENYARLYKEEKEQQKKTTTTSHGSTAYSGVHKTLTILGAGAWGKALGKILETKGVSVLYWNRFFPPLEEFSKNPSRKQDVLRHNQHKYAPQEEDDFLQERQEKGLFTHDLERALKYSKNVLISISAQGMRSLCQDIKTSGIVPKGVILCSKGLEEKTGNTMGDIVTEILETPMIGILSGPNLAKEVFQGLPCGVTFCSQHKDMMDTMKDYFSKTPFIIESSSDIVGLQLSGALKNVFAMAYGFVQGYWTNENLWATYFTLATKELGRLIIALGGQGATLLTYGGLGDLFLTCNSLKGRNSSFGRMLAHQWKTKGCLDLCPSTLVEGLHTLPGILNICKEKNIPCPLLEGFQNILNGQNTPEDWRQGW